MNAHYYITLKDLIEEEKVIRELLRKRKYYKVIFESFEPFELETATFLLLSYNVHELSQFLTKKKSLRNYYFSRSDLIESNHLDIETERAKKLLKGELFLSDDDFVYILENHKSIFKKYPQLLKYNFTFSRLSSILDKESVSIIKRSLEHNNELDKEKILRKLVIALYLGNRSTKRREDLYKFLKDNDLLKYSIDIIAELFSSFSREEDRKKIIKDLNRIDNRLLDEIIAHLKDVNILSDFIGYKCKIPVDKFLSYAFFGNVDDSLKLLETSTLVKTESEHNTFVLSSVIHLFLMRTEALDQFLRQPAIVEFLKESNIVNIWNLSSIEHISNFISGDIKKRIHDNIKRLINKGMKILPDNDFKAYRLNILNIKERELVNEVFPLEFFKELLKDDSQLMRDTYLKMFPRIKQLLKRKKRKI